MARSQRHTLVNRFTDRRLQEMRGVPGATSTSSGARLYVLRDDCRAMAAFPLVSRDGGGATLEGVILVKSREENAFGAEIVDFLKGPSDVIASGIKMGKFMAKAHSQSDSLENAVQQGLDRERVLVQRRKSMDQLIGALFATLADSQGFSPSRIATIVCSIGKTMLGGADVTLFMPNAAQMAGEEGEEDYDDDGSFGEHDLQQLGDEVRRQRAFSAIGEGGARAPVTARCGALDVVERGRQVFIKRVSDLKVYTPWRVLSAKSGSTATAEHSVICIPILRGGGGGDEDGGGGRRRRRKCLGAIEAHRFVNPGSPFGKGDVEVLEQVARVCAYCISVGRELERRQASLLFKDASLEDKLEKVAMMSAEAVSTNFLPPPPPPPPSPPPPSPSLRPTLHLPAED